MVELPLEVIYEIFIYAACTSKTFCRTLCEVTPWTKAFATPYLHATVILNSAGRVRYSLRQSSFSTNDGAIRNAWIGPITGAASVVFKHCENITHIAVHAGDLVFLVGPFSELMDLSAEAIARRPDMDWTLTGYVKPGSLLSLAVAFNHSDLHDTVSSGQLIMNKIKRLRMPLEVRSYAEDVAIFNLRCLTHLSVPFCYPSHNLSELETIMEHPSLQFLVVVILQDIVSTESCQIFLEWHQRINRTPRRVRVVSFEATSAYFAGDWEAEMWGGRSVWDECYT